MPMTDKTVQVVIEIPEGTYDLIKHNVQAQSAFESAYYAIRRGTVLPKGHGRLVDADELKKESVMCPTVGNSETLLLDIWNVERAPTIIEAEKEAEE